MRYSFKRALEGILILEALFPCLFFSWEFTYGSFSRFYPELGFFERLAATFDIGMLVCGLPFWILFFVGLFLRLTSLVLLSIGSLTMATLSLWIYYQTYEPYNPGNMGDEGMVFGLLFLYQIVAAPLFALFILILNWILKKFVPTLP